MDVPSTGPILPPQRMEWKDNVNDSSRPSGASESSFGAKLNQLSGVTNTKNFSDEGKNVLSKESYLKMMMEQVKSQDPFNPMKSDQFTQNIAMMSQLEQQVNMNKNLEKLLGQGNNMQIAALQLVGKNILADRSVIIHEKDKISSAEFKLPQDAQEVKIQIEDGSGEVVRSMELGTQNQGQVKLKWDGFLENGMPAPTGRYSFNVIAKGMDGAPVTMAMKTEGRVTGVTSIKGTTFLLLGEQKIALSDVETIKEGVNEVPQDPHPLRPSMATSEVAMKTLPSNMAPVAVDISSDAAKELAEENDRSPLERPHLSDLMPVMFR